uniref:Uncharacterized protein n=1 Tax=Steinernema glaseri TaxID=37863 RepID=A0A1I7YAH5_9BILA
MIDGTANCISAASPLKYLRNLKYAQLLLYLQIYIFEICTHHAQEYQPPSINPRYNSEQHPLHHREVPNLF